MVREIIEVEDEIYNLHIPKEYLHKKVEILVLPFDDHFDTKEKPSKNRLNAVSIETKNFRFDREEANAR